MPKFPARISLAQIHDDPRVANPNNLAGDYQRNLDITRIGDKMAWEDGPDRIDTALFYTYRHLDNPVTTYEFQHNNDTGCKLNTPIIMAKAYWLFGVNNYYGMANETRYQNIGGEPGAHILDRNLYALTCEAYGQIEQQLAGKLFGIFGTQGSYALRNIHQGFPSVAEQNEHYTGFCSAYRSAVRYR